MCATLLNREIENLDDDAMQSLGVFKTRVDIIQSAAASPANSSVSVETSQLPLLEPNHGWNTSADANALKFEDIAIPQVDLLEVNPHPLHKSAVHQAAVFETQRKTPTLKVSSTPLQEWEGYVEEVREETFVARLLDRSANGNVVAEIAEFDLSDVNEDDLSLLKVGAVFRWTIGYERRGGTRRKVSSIIFRRLPQWSERELSQSVEEAEALLKGISWE